MNWIKMADQKPPVDTPMLACRQHMGDFASGKFEDHGQLSERIPYMVFVLPRSAGVWVEESITHWALVELPAE